jgi:hypothetical protein
MPDFKVSTQYYQVENGNDRLGMGREDEYFWKTAKERANDDVGSFNIKFKDAPLDQE